MERNQYKTKAGLIQFKPHVDDLETMDIEGIGFCLACGEKQECVEPDACRYECDVCGKRKVYGAAEIALMGLYYTGERVTES